ncbi:hypothetical protein TVAG_249520 [Trichomonas vaginalis G3]|uniref:DUF3447 domain-containing protein n=1 Tax=Trichomonas vaginalis (strain ATCC PRA-98 / G3) TaxID=412133 RepID=A2DCF5_TRIV3|nr:ankyrin repeat and EF-Hand domain-containing protein 1 family [Trichomonas vaginalis G3]EAY21892.1 hypothetical protein TVAG_249520 [Trichomonas vaginalis G3]KAI5487632.1 ankyrin repeat and EF-Hand domain-containing protein 1 family [Trichomonas vaginalis G3]|eukprot:XP_001582878.1 hypothetical protein [Trichomonas vaginalis G3]
MEDTFFTVNDENYQDFTNSLSEYLEKHPLKVKYFLRLAYKVAEVNPLRIWVISEIYNNISEKARSNLSFHEKLYRDSPLQRLLNAKIRQSKGYPDAAAKIKEICDLIPESANPLEYYIVHDMLDELIELSCNPNFPLNQLHLCLAAEYGACKCFKFMMQSFPFDPICLEYAIKGGNLEIFRLVVQSDSKLTNAYEYAIKYHKNDIADWLKLNFRFKDEIRPASCLDWMNTRAFIYHMRKKSTQFLYTPLEMLITNGFYEVTKEFIERFVDKRTVNEVYNWKDTPLTLVCHNGWLDLAKLLIDKGADITLKQPLISAIFSRNFDLVDYLISLGCKLDSEVISLAKDPLMKEHLRNKLFERANSYQKKYK